MKAFFATLLMMSSFCSLAESKVAFEPLVLWNKPNLHVCWRSINKKTDFSPEIKQKVRQIVEAEYSPSRTGIYFYGWEECSALTDTYDIRIIQDVEGVMTKDPLILQYSNGGQNTLGSAFIGERGIAESIKEEIEEQFGYFNKLPHSPENSQLYLKFMRYSFQSYGLEILLLTALHEFGHVAGLRHEHIRYDEAKEDPNCSRLPLGLETPFDTTEYFESYDPNSIMNYCWLSALEETGTTSATLHNVQDHTLLEEHIDPITKQVMYKYRIGLSQMDVLGLQKMYSRYIAK